MESRIENIEELRAEMKRLKRLKSEQEYRLKEDLKDLQMKLSVVGKILGYISPFSNKNKDSLFSQDTGMVGLGMLLLDKLVLGNSGGAVKVISELLFAKAASSISKEDIEKLIAKITGWFKKKVKGDVGEDDSENEEDDTNPFKNKE